MLIRGVDQRDWVIVNGNRSLSGSRLNTDDRDIILERGDDVETIEGNGFGCTLFRAEMRRVSLFICRQPPYVDFDPAFHERLKAKNLKVKHCWDAECEHLENDTRPVMTWDHWPMSW